MLNPSHRMMLDYIMRSEPFANYFRCVLEAIVSEPPSFMLQLLENIYPLRLVFCFSTMAEIIKNRGSFNQLNHEQGSWAIRLQGDKCISGDRKWKDRPREDGKLVKVSRTSRICSKLFDCVLHINRSHCAIVFDDHSQWQWPKPTGVFPTLIFFLVFSLTRQY